MIRDCWRRDALRNAILIKICVPLTERRSMISRTVTFASGYSFRFFLVILSNSKAKISHLKAQCSGFNVARVYRLAVAATALKWEWKRHEVIEFNEWGKRGRSRIHIYIRARNPLDDGRNDRMTIVSSLFIPFEEIELHVSSHTDYCGVIETSNPLRIE